MLELLFICSFTFFILLTYALIQGLISEFLKKRLIIRTLLRQQPQKTLTTEQLKLLRKIYKKRFKDNRVFKVTGKLHRSLNEARLRRLVVRSAYWPDIDQEETGECQYVSTNRLQVEGVVHQKVFYAIRINDFDILAESEPFYALPQVKKVNPVSFDLSCVLIPIVLINMFFMAVMDYYDSLMFFIVMTLLLGSFPIYFICREIYESQWLYEFKGHFHSVEYSEEVSINRPGNLNGFPVEIAHDVFKEGKEYTVHGHICHTPDFHLDVVLVDGKNPSFSLEHKKKSLLWCLLLWMMITSVLISMTTNFYHSVTYKEYHSFATHHLHYDIARDVDTRALSKLDSGDAIKLQGLYFSPGEEHGMIIVRDGYDPKRVNAITQSIIDSVRPILFDSHHRVKLSKEARRNWHKAEVQFMNPQASLYRSLESAKAEIAAQTPLRVDIGDGRFKTQVLTLSQLRDAVFHLSRYPDGKRITYGEQYQHIRKSVIHYLYGWKASMYLSVSFFDPSEKKLVGYVYQPVTSIEPIDNIALSWKYYLFWLAVSSVMLIYSAYAYATAEQRYAHLYQQEMWE
ncbi:hypothetical protein [Photobacterium galatheae]|uniref:Intracellular growth attenuator protein igaA n=1 Tax=Photobacterium galatheae TaxID=1654360 RepID=A0A066RSI3_9GAMM|nr:hypothetical protein [Photobacterium galatheae]KDM93294.1 hypothetical protein EA58_01405 [Photobacterium galatheae]MCM0150419.1 hypothetical protein [Photobacterium galatheae]